MAIIGMAVRLPQADDITAFRANLLAGRDSIREISAYRKKLALSPPEENYQLSAFIEDIDSFDYAFFGVTKGEANNMAPQHRLVLQTAYQAIENAGYDPLTLRGRTVSVYLGDTKLSYHTLAAVPEPTVVMGSHASATAGRLSRFLDLRGPAAMIDTSCSSSLVAVHLAVNDLANAESELALVGSASLTLFPDRLNGEADIGIRSPDGKTRCFSADASGTGSGEAVVIVMLKRLDAAIRDADNIHAVIKAVAVNNVGGRSATLTSPDSDAEAEVIERAWTKAKIDPRTITYIEAHGTATRLGDPIEVEAMDAAFRRVTPEKHFCNISSVKSNLGHTWSAAGIVGLVKAALAVRHGELYPNLHCEQLNPLIDFANSALVVTRKVNEWKPVCGIRRAGVSSFGVMGTDAHAVLEQPPASAVQVRNSASAFWFPVSAKSQWSLAANVLALRKWLDEQSEISLSDVQRTLVTGRAHWAHRFCAVATDVNALLSQLAVESNGLPIEPPRGLVLIVPDKCQPSSELVNSLMAHYDDFEEAYVECLNAAKDDSDTNARQFAFQYAFVALLRHLGIQFTHSFGHGIGKIVLAAGYGRISINEAVAQASIGFREGATYEFGDSDPWVGRLLDRFGSDRICFVEVTPDSILSQAISEGGLSHFRAAYPSNEAGGLAHFFRALYVDGVSWKWEMAAGFGRRIELPPYQFEPIHCWMTNMRDNVQQIAPTTEAKADSRAMIERGDVLTTLIRVFEQVLDVQTVSADASFFSLGGDSISGMDMLGRLESIFKIDLDQEVIFDHDTPTKLAGYIANLLPGRALAVKKSSEAKGGVSVASPDVETLAGEVSDDRDWFSLSPAQLHVWLASQFTGGSVAFNLTRSFRIAGQINEQALRGALTDITDRHTALRARFAFRDGNVNQHLAPTGPANGSLEIINLGEPTPDDPGLVEVCRPFAQREFDLTNGPLLRIQLACFADGQALMTLSTHHIVADGWSLDILVRDLAELYAARTSGGKPVLCPIRFDYREYYDLEANRVDDSRERAKKYWLDRFKNGAPSLALPPAHGESNAAAFVGRYRTYDLSNEIWTRVKQFSREEGGTPFGCLLGLFAVVFSPFAHETELVLGTSLAGRSELSSHQAVGMFVRTVPMLLEVRPDSTWRGLYAHVRSALRDAWANLAYPYEDLANELRRRSITCDADLFEVLIEQEQFGAGSSQPMAPMERLGLRVSPVQVALDTSVFPINIMLSERSNALKAVIRYDSQRFDECTIDRLWSTFAYLAETLIASADCELSGLPLVAPDEERRLCNIGYRTLAFDKNWTVARAIEHWADVQPNAIALLEARTERSYAELNCRANRLARYLQTYGSVRAGDLVALIMDRSALVVETILAVWKCGAAYVPIDPNYPIGYVSDIISSAKPSVVAYDPRQFGIDRAKQLGSGWFTAAVSEDVATAENDRNLDVVIDDTALAYVIFTSGSTGSPKGAMIQERGMLNHLWAKISDLKLTQKSVVAHTASNTFDISVWQMFAGLVAGGRTTIFAPALQFDPDAFARRLIRDAVTVLECVPSHLNSLLDSWTTADPPRLGKIAYLVLTGEAVPPALLTQWFAAFPTIPVVNAYGPTEASDDITHHLMNGPVTDGLAPIGRPIPNTSVYVLDQYSRTVPQGALGEICVAGVCVGQGYVNEPLLTQLSFKDDPFQPGRRMYRTGDQGRWSSDGTLYYTGRSDNQIKIRGFRVELGEVEQRVTGLPGVKSAAAVAAADGSDRIFAYVVLEKGHLVEDCKAHLARQVPGFMVPAFIEVDELPMTPNGKIDRRALNSRAQTPLLENGFVGGGACSPDEVFLQGIWQEILGRPVGMNERFFDIGGNSLRAIQVLSRIRARADAEITLEQLFANPTIGALAKLLPTATEKHEKPLESLGGAGRYAIAPTQHLLLGIEQNELWRDAFNRNDLYAIRGPLDPMLLRESIAAIFQRHEILRTTFEIENSNPTMIVRAPDELALPFTEQDFRGRDDAVAAFISDRLHRAFDIATEPLARFDLLRTGDENYNLLVSMHQLVSDGRSAQVLREDILHAYDELAGGRSLAAWPAAVQYKDVASWRASRLTPDLVEDHRLFWREELRGASSIIGLEAKQPRPVTTTLMGERVYYSVDDGIAAALFAFARASSVTDFVVVWTALALSLSGATDNADVTVGTYTRGRNRTEFEDGIGFYINTVPLRMRLSPTDDMGCVLAQAQHTMLQAFQHEEYPYELTMQDLGWQRGCNRTPLFDVMVAIEDDNEASSPHHRLTFEPRELPRRSKEGDLLVVFRRTAAQLKIAITYNTSLFHVERVRQFCRALSDVLDALPKARTVAEVLERGKILA